MYYELYRACNSYRLFDPTRTCEDIFRFVPMGDKQLFKKNSKFMVSEKRKSS